VRAADSVARTNPTLRPVINYARAIYAELRAAGVRANIDLTSDPIKAKIANAEQTKTHTMPVIGKRDLEAGNIVVRVHGQGRLGDKPRAECSASWRRSSRASATKSANDPRSRIGKANSVRQQKMSTRRRIAFSVVERCTGSERGSCLP
jgi:histidyl-tRNA synthetase